jgi:hypothetical protein
MLRGPRSYFLEVFVLLCTCVDELGGVGLGVRGGGEVGVGRRVVFVAVSAAFGVFIGVPVPIVVVIHVLILLQVEPLECLG